MDLGEGEHETDAPSAAAPAWENEPLEGDEDATNVFNGVESGHTCYLCEHGHDMKNPTVIKIHTALSKQGDVSDSTRFMVAGRLQSTLDSEGKLQPLQCARELYTHTKRHTLDTTEINGENLQTLRLVTRGLRKRLQKRNVESGETEVDHKQLDAILKVMRVQSDILKFRPEGLPFTTNKRQRTA
jgi:hypothetical protein